MGNQSKSEKIRIFIVDDHALVIDSLTDLLKDQEQFAIVGSARNGLELLEKLPGCPADIVLLDIRMPKMNGIKAIEKVKAISPTTKILMVSTISERDVVNLANAHKADGYISKSKGKEDFIGAIERVIKDEFVVLVDQEEEEDPIQIDAGGPQFNLTGREREVLALIIDEQTTQEIAENLFLSTHTVERHRKNIMNKLDVRNVAGMVRVAMEHDLHKA